MARAKVKLTSFRGTSRLDRSDHSSTQSRSAEVPLEKPNHASLTASPANASPAHAPAYMWPYPVALVLALGVLGGGIYLAAKWHVWHLFAVGCACIVAVLVTWPIALVLIAHRQANSKLLESI